MVLICCIYIRPNSDPVVYEQHACCVQKLCELASGNDSLVVLGDYNLPHLTWCYDTDINAYLPTNASSESELTLTESVLGSGLYQVLNIPNRNARLLDLAFVSDPDNFEVFEPPSPILNVDPHHKPFLMKLYLPSPSPEDNLDDILQFDFKTYDVNAVCDSIARIDWNGILHGSSVNDAVFTFYDVLFNIIRQHVPRRKHRSICCTNQPWWNSNLRRLRNRMRKARKRFFKHRTDENRNALQSIEREYSSNQSDAFREYITGLENNAKSDPSTFWSYVKRRRQSNNVPCDMKFRNMVANSAEDCANLLAEFFKTVYNSNPPPVTQEALNSVPAYDLHMPVIDVSVDDVFRRFIDLDSSKGPGPDGIPPLFIKQCAAALALPASIIFNRSLSSGEVPELWKLAAITPIHKSGNLHDAENYRGISILNCFSKVLESFVHDALYGAVSSVISPHQHGFVKNRSTTTNLMSFVTSVTNTIEKKGQVDAIYVDFAKAFDKVPHALTVEKLRKMGLPEWITTWIHSYLTSRSAFVKVHGHTSTRFNIPSGVPQGSHLGPLLFVLFINDLCDLIESEKLLYADDLKIFRKILSHLDCCAMQRDLDTLLRWCRTNGMDVNVSKCNIISFTRSRTPMLHGYSIGLHSLSRVTTIKDLGVVINSKANFNEHIASTTAKAFSLLGFLRRITKSFTDVYSLKSLYCAIVRSVLEYAVQVWAPYHQVQADRLERVQRSFIRYALRRLPWNDPIRLPSYESRCLLIGLETLSSRRMLLQRIFCFDLITNRIDCSNLLSRINFHAPRRNLRNHVLLYIPAHRTLYGHHNPLDNCCRLFNMVNDKFDFNISKTTYKTRIRSLI